VGEKCWHFGEVRNGGDREQSGSAQITRPLAVGKRAKPGVLGPTSTVTVSLTQHPREPIKGLVPGGGLGEYLDWSNIKTKARG